MKLKIKVSPNSKKQEIVKVNDSEYKVFLKKPAENNKANIELIKLLIKHFKKKVNIIRGFTSRNKIVEISYEN